MKGTLHRERPVGAAAQKLLTLMGLLRIIGLIGTARAAEWEPDLDSEPHRYFQRTAVDRFSRRIPELAAGRLPLDRSSERAFLKSLLRALDIPESSQLLVFSNTSLQLSLINPDNPRALYFSDDLYLGYVPGGKIEVATIDAELGAVFYIFDIPRSDSRVVVERARRCMNCHANEDTLKIPGLSVKSVAPGPGGGPSGDAGGHVLHVLVAQLLSGLGGSLVSLATRAAAVGDDQRGLVGRQRLGEVLLDGIEIQGARDVGLGVGLRTVHIDEHGLLGSHQGFDLLDANIRELPGENGGGKEQSGGDCEDFLHSSHKFVRNRSEASRKSGQHKV